MAIPARFPSANQITNTVGYGNEQSSRLECGLFADLRLPTRIVLYNITQASYNTDCCGFSAQFRRFALGARNENQWRLLVSDRQCKFVWIPATPGSHFLGSGEAGRAARQRVGVWSSHELLVAFHGLLIGSIQDQFAMVQPDGTRTQLFGEAG